MIILNVQQAAKFLGKTPAALRNGYKRWGVPHFRLGGQIKFTQEALQEWVNGHMTVTPDSPGAVLSPTDGRKGKRISVGAKLTSHSGKLTA